MDSISTALTCLLCAAQTNNLPPAIAHWESIIAAASVRFDVPEPWIAHVMAAESGGSTTLNRRPITSAAGAMGLMQIMPQTYSGLRARYGFGADAYDPHDNIFAGAAYLHELYQRYGYPNLFAAYNAGPSRVDDYLTHGRPLPRVTDAYVAMLTGTHVSSSLPSNPSRDAAPTQPATTLFFVNHTRETEGSAAASASPLFVTLSSAQR
ncbi:MAG: lytic transglycosylase domain-containing protein [Alphaproteobacteria bacterium]|nr:lytic transglycosylase domain-containing protein [Alphaproteobacteria bacterium]